MGLCRKSRQQGSRRRVGIRLRRRLQRSGWCGPCERSWGPSMGRCSGLRRSSDTAYILMRPLGHVGLERKEERLLVTEAPIEAAHRALRTPCDFSDVRLPKPLLGEHPLAGFQQPVPLVATSGLVSGARPVRRCFGRRDRTDPYVRHEWPALPCRGV